MSFEIEDSRSVLHRFDAPPDRVVSLVPCITETLFELGLEEEVVGVTRYCVRPRQMPETALRVGGEKNPDIELIKSLEPQLVLVGRDENRLEDVKAIEGFAPVFSFDVRSVMDAVQMTLDLGALFDRVAVADHYALSVLVEIERVRAKTEEYPPVGLVVFVWKEPWMVIGGNTYSDNLITLAGGVNLFGDREGYLRVDADDFAETPPSVVMLPSEPYSFSEKDSDIVHELVGGEARLLPLDGQRLAWFGWRTLGSVEYVNRELFAGLRR